MDPSGFEPETSSLQRKRSFSLRVNLCLHKVPLGYGPVVSKKPDCIIKVFNELLFLN